MLRKPRECESQSVAPVPTAMLMFPDASFQEIFQGRELGCRDRQGAAGCCSVHGALNRNLYTAVLTHSSLNPIYF